MSINFITVSHIRFNQNPTEVYELKYVAKGYRDGILTYNPVTDKSILTDGKTNRQTRAESLIEPTY
jgi:hypothetical protein